MEQHGGAVDYATGYYAYSAAAPMLPRIKPLQHTQAITLRGRESESAHWTPPSSKRRRPWRRRGSTTGATLLSFFCNADAASQGSSAGRGGAGGPAPAQGADSTSG